MGVNQVTWNWVINGQTINNVQYYDIPTETPQVRQEFADAMANFATFDLLPHLSPSCSLTGFTMRALDGGPAVAFDVPLSGGPISGVSSGQLYDLTSPLQVYYRSQTAKPNRGWVKHSGLTESQWEGTSWSAAAIAGFTSFYTIMTSGFTITGGDCILGICRPDFTANVPIAFNLIDSFVVRTYTRKQTSRRPQD